MSRFSVLWILAAALGAATVAVLWRWEAAPVGLAPDSRTASAAAASAPVTTQRRTDVPASRPVRVRGRVLAQESQAPLPEATVELRALEQSELDPGALVQVERDGTFTGEVAAEEGRFVARADGRVAARGSFMRGEDSEPVDLGEVLLARGARISGRVMRAADRTGVGGARLWLLVDSEPAAFVGSSAASGAFTLDQAIACLPLEQSQLLAAESAQGCGAVEPVLRQGTEQSELEILIGPVGSARVEVRESDGSPVPDARVRVACLPDTLRWLREVPAAPAMCEMRTDARGFARLAVVPIAVDGQVPGVSAEADGHDWRSADLTLAAGQEASVRVTLARLASAFLHGVVRSAATHDGLQARLEISKVERHRTGPDGAFRVPVTATKGDRLVVTAEAEGHRPGRCEFTMPDRGEIPVAFELEPHPPVAPIRGLVVDADGEPRERVSLTLTGASGQKGGFRTSSDKDGVFVFSATAGRWLLTFSDFQRGWWELPEAREVAGGQTDIRVVLRRFPKGPTRLVADVRTADGSPLPELDVHHVRCESDPWQRAHDFTVANGRITAEGLRPGTWRLTMEVGELGVLWRRFTVAADQSEVTLPITLGAPGTLVGEVVLDGVPPKDAAPLLELAIEPETGLQVEMDGFAPAIATHGRILVRPARTRRFRVTGVLPGQRLAVWLKDPDPWDSGYAGATTVTVPANGEAQVVVRVVPMGKVHVRSTRAFPAGTIRFWCDDSAARPMFPESHQAGPLDFVACCPPGEWRWQIDLVEAGARFLEHTATFDLHVRSGETTDVLWPDR